MERRFIRCAYHGIYSYTWTPSISGTFYIRAVWSGDSNYNGSTSTSQVLTVLKNNPPTTPVVISPNGGEIWGGTRKVTWTASTDPDGDPMTYKVEYG